MAEDFIIEDVAFLVDSGTIKDFYTDASFKEQKRKLRSRPITELASASSRELQRTGIAVSSISAASEALVSFTRAGLRQVPYLHLRCYNVDVVTLVSEASRMSNRFTVAGPNGFRRTGRHHEFDVTIIVPVYGVAAYIERCALSLLNQNFGGRYEVLFVDDGSPDNSVEIINSSISNAPNMRVLSKPNGGAASARNYGLSFAKGEFVGFVDGDDYVSSDYIDVLFRAALLGDAEISQAEFSYVNASNGEVTPHREWFPTSRTAFGPLSAPAFQMMIQTPGIWRRLYSLRYLLHKGIKFEEGFRRHDDLPFNIEALSKTNRIAVARRNVYFYILGRDGQDVGATDERLFIHFRLFAHTFKRINAQYWSPGYFQTLLITAFGHHLWAYERIEPRLKAQYLAGIAVQVFRTPGPFGMFGRYRTLRNHFRKHHLLLLKVIALACLRPTKVLPSDLPD